MRSSSLLPPSLPFPLLLPTNSLFCNTYRYQKQPNAINFAQASYTLRVFDERGYNAIATGGYFDGSNINLNFAMYTPAAYTALAAGKFLFLYYFFVLLREEELVLRSYADY